MNLYELGQSAPLSDAWLVSDWEHFSSITDWSADNAWEDTDGVHLILDEAPSGAREPYHGGEIQSDAVVNSGTFTWTAKAPELVSGAVFGMFTFQEDYLDPRCEFDFEFVGNTQEIQVVVHMAGPDGERISSPGRTIDLGFDAAEGFHTYQVVVTRHDEAVFLVDGEVIAYFSEADMPGGVWETGPMRSYANLWASDSYWWAGDWKGLDEHEPLEATLRGAEVQADVYAGIGQMDGTSSADLITGTAGDEIIRGEIGNDSLRGGAGRDFLRGGTGKDLLDGGKGSDTFDGGKGNDTLLGGAGHDDFLRGGNGHDALDGGKGTDMLTGGNGNDEFIFVGPGQSGDSITDFGNRSGDNDRILIDASSFKGGLDEGGHLSRDAFQVGANHHAKGDDVRFLFDTRTETLWFDRNGSKDDGLTLVADLQDGARLQHDDIWLI
jgi:serralysin